MEQMEVSAEVHFAQKLASNEKKNRDRALKRLRKYLSIRSSQGGGMSNDDFMKIWKGLHYCMWMQDKPLIQEELSHRVANLIHSFSKINDSLRFVNVFFITEAREWLLIDRFRIDKFMMLIRDMLHETFVLMSQAGWPISACEAFSQYLANSVMNEDNPKLPDGLKLHMADIFMPELRKVSLEQMTGQKLTILMFPFASFILRTRKMNLASKVVCQTITPVLQQFGSWPKRKQEVDEEGDQSPSLESEDDGDEEEMEWHEEDEAGKESSNEALRRKPLKFDLTKLLKMMFKMAEQKKVHSKNRAMFFKIVQRYSTVDATIQSSESKVTNVIEDSKDMDDNEDDGAYTQNILESFIKSGEDGLPKRKRRRRKKPKQPHCDENPCSEQAEMEVEDDEDPVSKKASKDDISQDLESNHKSGNKRKRISGDLGELSTNVAKRSRPSDTPTASVDSNPKGKGSGETKKGAKENKTHDKAEGSPTPSKKKSQSPKDKNSNSGSRIEMVEGNLNIYSSLDIVKYPEGGRVHKFSSMSRVSQNKSEVDLENPLDSDVTDKSSSSYSSESLSASSAADLKVYLPSPSPKQSGDKMVKTQKGKRAKKSPIKTRVDNAEPIEETGVKAEAKSGRPTSLLESITPRNLIKKAVSMMMPSSDPGPAKDSLVEYKDESSMTPGTKKKVVFDLRKNKANKFQDYLKGLASESPPIFEPSKSPSQGILKSPSLSSTNSSISLISYGQGSKKKAGKGDRKSQGIQSTPKSEKRSPKNVNRRSKSKSPKKK